MLFLLCSWRAQYSLYYEFYIHSKLLFHSTFYFYFEFISFLYFQEIIPRTQFCRKTIISRTSCKVYPTKDDTSVMSVLGSFNKYYFNKQILQFSSAIILLKHYLQGRTKDNDQNPFKFDYLRNFMSSVMSHPLWFAMLDKLASNLLLILMNWLILHSFFYVYLPLSVCLMVFIEHRLCSRDTLITLWKQDTFRRTAAEMSKRSCKVC